MLHLRYKVISPRVVSPRVLVSSVSVLLLSAIVVSLYTLTRNQRTIRFNNRYLYNIVILYLLAQILYKVYINPYLTAI